jgi:hypothetical protein
MFFGSGGGKLEKRERIVTAAARPAHALTW